MKDSGRVRFFRHSSIEMTAVGVHRAPEHPLGRMEAVVPVGVAEPVRDDHYIDVAHRTIAAMGS